MFYMRQKVKGSLFIIYWLLFPLDSNGSIKLKTTSSPNKDAHTNKGAVVSTFA